MAEQRPRITFEIDVNENGTPGELCLYFNQTGREALIGLLRDLTPEWEHQHLDARSSSIEDVSLDEVAYRDTGQVVRAVKLLLRMDEWDEEYFPDVMNKQPPRLLDE